MCFSGHVLLRLGSWGLAGTGDSEDAFLGHIAPGSCVYHNMGHFGSCFTGCREKAVNSEDPAAHCLLNLVNRLRAQVKRMFAVHLRIHRKNVPLWLNEKAFQREKMGEHGVRRIPVVLLQKNLLVRENPQKTGCFRPLAILLFILLSY